MNKTVFCFLFLMFSLKLGLAQKTDRDYVWPDKGSYDALLDTFHSEDAVILYKEERLSIEAFDPSQFATMTTQFLTHVKMKILTPDGVTKNTRMSVLRHRGSELKTLDARTIKKDGQVVDLFSKDIHEIDLGAAIGKKSESQVLRFSIPGAEVGDEIEFVVLMSYHGIVTTEEKFLNDENCFCLLSNYLTTIPLSFQMDAKCYNNMPRPVIDTLHNRRSFRFSMKNLPPLHQDEFSIPQLEFPFLRFAIRYIPITHYSTTKDIQHILALEPGTWEDYGSTEVEMLDNAPAFLRSRLEADFNGLYDAYFPIWGVKDTLKQMVSFFNYIHDSIRIVDVSYKEYDNSVEYYLKRKEVLQPLMLYFFDKMFRRLKMNYYFGLGKDKYTGPFDQDFITSQLTTHKFLGFELNKHFYYFFIPTMHHAYQFGEVPANLRGTDAMLISRNTQADPVRIFTFPITDRDKNFSKTSVFLTVDLKKSSVSRSDRQIMSGNYSTDKRFNLIEASKKEKEIETMMSKEEQDAGSVYQLDSARIDKIERVSPFLTTIKRVSHSDKAVRTLDKDVYSVSLNGIIRHDMLPYGGWKRKTTCSIPYLYDDNFKVYLIFDKPVELVNSDQIKGSWEGIVGKYGLKVVQVNETTILVDSDYNLLTQNIAPSDYPSIAKMQIEAEKALSLQVIVRTK
jgi:hypothetical protein